MTSLNRKNNKEIKKISLNLKLSKKNQKKEKISGKKTKPKTLWVRRKKAS